MIIKEEFLSRLRKIFDLNLYEVKVWTALLSRGTSTAGELSNISEVPRSRTYDILESLEKKGFIVMKLGKPIKFIALKPSEVIERVKRNLAKSTKERTERLEKLKSDDILKELNTLFTKGIKFVEPTDLSGSLKGRQNLYNHLDMMVRDAEKEIIIVTTEGGINRKFEALYPSLLKAKKRNVKIKIAAPIDKNNIKIAKEFKKIAEVRNMTNLKSRFIIIDSNQVMFMLLNDEKKVVDYVYQNHQGPIFGINTVTDPLFINTTWSYLFNWYGEKKYSYTPIWLGFPQKNFPGGKIKFSDKKPTDDLTYFLIIEPTPGIPKEYIKGYPKYENTRSKLLSVKKIGTFTIEKRRMTKYRYFSRDDLFRIVKETH